MFQNHNELHTLCETLFMGNFVDKSTKINSFTEKGWNIPTYIYDYKSEHYKCGKHKIPGSSFAAFFLYPYNGLCSVY